MPEDRTVTLEPRDADRKQGIAITATELRVDGTDGSFSIIEEVTFRLTRGRTLGIVGETGSGKTTVALSLLGYARPGVAVAGGSVRLGETDLLALSPVELRRRRGREIAYVPQDPSTGLTPGMRIGDALNEMLAIHAPNESDPGARVAAALRDAQLPDDPAFQRRYPFQLSGGQQQRVAIALAVICRPRVIVMDEPTTGLDVTTQARLLNVIREIVRDSDAALVYVTHDLGVIRARHGDVRRPSHRAWPDRHTLHLTISPVHARPARGRPARRRSELQAAGPARPRGRTVGPSARLPV